MGITFNLAQIVAICTALTSILTAYNLVRKPLKEKEEKDKKEAEEKAKQEKRILELLDNDKKHLEKLDDTIERLTEATDIQGDMIYAMLSHMATNNNTGGMQSALDKYNSFYRRNH